MRSGYDTDVVRLIAYTDAKLAAVFRPESPARQMACLQLR
jgi:hypothetical protein